MYANSLLKVFIDSGAKLFGPQFITFNVHSLLYLPDDVLKHGVLDGFSAFPFENKLKNLKKFIEKKRKAFAANSQQIG